MKLTENTKVRIKVPKHLYEAVQAELAKSQEMEEMKIPHDGHEKVEEDAVEEDVMTGARIDAEKLGDLLNMPAEYAGAAIVGGIVLGVIKGPQIVSTVKSALAVAADKGEEYVTKLKNYFKKEKIKHPELGKVPELNQPTSSKPSEMGEAEEVQETLDLESLMEAVKDAAKKKAEEKKKKEAEAKKKKEAEAKKKADAKKKK